MTSFQEGFIRGLLDARPDETLDQARERFQRETEAMNFDTATLAKLTDDHCTIRRTLPRQHPHN